jgi:hypothetical protein
LGRIVLRVEPIDSAAFSDLAAKPASDFGAVSDVRDAAATPMPRSTADCGASFLGFIPIVFAGTMLARL